MMNIFKKIKVRISKSAFPYTLILAFIFCGFIILEVVYSAIPVLNELEFFPKESVGFISQFIEWFSLLYGVFMPLLIVGVWEQLDKLGREFEREAEIVRSLHAIVLKFSEEISETKDKTLHLLGKYVGHVKNKYKREARDESPAKVKGDKLLRDIKDQYYSIIHSKIIESKKGELLASELLDQLNKLIDTRGSRIAISNQRLFESLRFISLLASVIFLVPSYLVKFHQSYGFIDTLLVFGMIFLVFLIQATIEDLDEPFEGSRKINPAPWHRLHDEIQKSLEERKVSSSELPQVQ